MYFKKHKKNLIIQKAKINISAIYSLNEPNLGLNVPQAIFDCLHFKGNLREQSKKKQIWLHKSDLR